MLKTVVLLHIFIETRIYIFSEFFDEYNLKNIFILIM